MFQTHAIDPVTDTVIAYSRADGEVEAMLLQGGVITQLYRDPTQAGGWNVHTFGDHTDVIDLVAGVSAPAPKYNDPVKDPVLPPTLKVFYRTRAQSDLLYVAVHSGGAAPEFTTTTVPWKSTGKLQLSVGYDDSVVVAAITESSSLTALDGRLDFWTDTHHNHEDIYPTSGSLTGFPYRTGPAPAGLAPGWAATITDPWLSSGSAQVHLALPAGTYGPFKLAGLNYTVNPPSVALWSWSIDRHDPDASTPKTSTMASGALNSPPAASSTTTAYRIEATTSYGSLNLPAVVVRTLDKSGGDAVQRLWVASPDDSHGNVVWAWNELVLPDQLTANRAMVVSTAIRPLPASEVIHDQATAARRFLDVFALADGTVNVLRQAPQGDANLDYSKPAYCPAIALHPGVADMTSQPGLSTGNELLLVAQDGTLVSLEKDPTTGIWADHPVHLPANDLAETTAYRVSVGVVDAWQLPVADQPLRITASSSVTALVNGASLSLGSDPVTVKTDPRGLLSLSLVADGLSAPTLTVAGDGVPTATIDPSAPVNTYFQGGSPLNYLDPLDDDTLAEAKAPDGSLVAPQATKSRSDAHDAVTNMALAARQASSPNQLSARRSATSRRRDGQLTGTSKAELTGILHDIDKWAHDALHAIKKGAAKIEQIGYDAATKTFTLAADFAHWTDNNVVKIVVKGVEDAAHVIHAFLNKLGGEIIHAIKWLAAEVIATFKDAVDLAHDYDGWLDDACTFLATQARHQAGIIDGWLAAKQSEVKADLLALAHRYTKSTTLATMVNQPPSGAKVGSVRSPRTAPTKSQNSLGGSASADDDQSSPHGNWFWHKIRNEMRGGLTLTAAPSLQTDMKKLLTAAGQALADFETAFKDFMAFLRVTVTHPSKALTLGVQDLLTAISALVDAVFVLARAMLSVLLDVLASMCEVIPGMLTTPLSATPIVGKLFSLIGLGNVHLGTIITTVYAFPAAVAYKASNKGKGRPFGSASGTLRGAAGEGADGMVIAATSTLALWAGMDTIAAGTIAAGGEPDSFFALLDIASPLLVGLLTVPATKDGKPYLSPPVSGDDADAYAFLSWLVAMIPSGLVAAGTYLERTYPDDKDLPNQQSMIMFGTAACGVISLATGCKALTLSGGQGWEFADVILNAMPDIVIPGVDKRLAESTEFISAGVTCALTAACGEAGAAAHAFAG